MAVVPSRAEECRFVRVIRVLIFPDAATRGVYVLIAESGQPAASTGVLRPNPAASTSRPMVTSNGEQPWVVTVTGGYPFGIAAWLEARGICSREDLTWKRSVRKTTSSCLELRELLSVGRWLPCVLLPRRPRRDCQW